MTDKKRFDGARPLALQVFNECDAMVRFALASGLKIPVHFAEHLASLELGREARQELHKIDQDSWARPREIPQISVLGPIHQTLTKLVAPATPRGILLLSQQEESFWRFLGPIPMIRQLIAMAIVSLLLFVSVSLSEFVNTTEMAKSLLSHYGWELLINEVFLLTAAAMGASFAGLYQANKNCVEGKYDPRYDSSYWVRFVLGLIAGLTLAELISVTPDSNENLPLGSLSKPLLAMLGGFSSDLVYRLLSRLVETVESLVRGGTRELIQQRAQYAREKAAASLEGDRLKLASGLMELDRQVNKGASVETLSAELARVMDQLMAGGDLPAQPTEKKET